MGERISSRGGFACTVVSLMAVNLLLCSPVSHSMPVLNDTGEWLCTNDSAYVSDATIADDIGSHPRQDCRYGRDAAAVDGTLTKQGGGAAGFDFTKIANDGSTLPVEAQLGSAPGDWGCNLDHNTGLMWEVKSDDGGLRDTDWTYWWYSSDSTTNGGNPGTITGTDNCGATLSGYTNGCNTDNYVAAVNAAGLCGYNDWRMPSIHELEGLIHFGEKAPPYIDQAYFPTHRVNNWSWSGVTAAYDPSTAWRVKFENGSSHADPKGLHSVMLVRNGSPPLVDDAQCEAGTKLANSYVSTPSADFTDNSDGTVTHQPTGLVWKRCVEGMSWSGSSCTGTAAAYTSYSAILNQARAAADAGYGDWRVPNVKELRSIHEVCGHTPAINTVQFPASPSGELWSSTTYSPDATQVWRYSFANGLSVGALKVGASSANLRLVRAGKEYARYDRAAGFAKSWLNDTAVVEIQDNSAADPTRTVSLDGGTHPRQDGRFGRAALALAGRLTKIGGGVAGRDYTKVSHQGNNIADTATIGTGPADWACTRDNVTGLLWEVKTQDSGPRDAGWTYTWYSSEPTDSGGVAGTLGTDTCGGTMSSYSNQCNTENYVDLVGMGPLCGCDGWRMPTKGELESLVDRSATTAPYIDLTYFPNQPGGSNFASHTSAINTSYAWGIGFWDGGTGYSLKSDALYVRLVCDGPILVPQ